MIGQLTVVADLVAADQPGHAMGQHHALQRQRIGVGAQAAAARAEMAADIEPGPVIGLLEHSLGLQRQGLERHVGRRGGFCQCQHAERGSGQRFLPSQAAG
jgi:hypothetical protein